MVDMLAPLYRLPDNSTGPHRVRRAMAYERLDVIEFVATTWNQRWASEVSIAFNTQPIRCFVAITNGALCGFACWDATFRGFFGPMGVAPDLQGKGTGNRLLISALEAMRNDGYAYAIIGDVDTAEEFYKKTVGATPIANSVPGAYEYDLRPQAPGE